MADVKEDLPLVNLDKISELISFYKFPLILTLVGLIFISIPVILLYKNSQSEGGGVVFSEATGSASSDGRKIKIDIEGSVSNPGVYEFTDGERIEDAIKRAGGYTEKADLDWMEGNLNKAAKLVDGGKIYIPAIGEKLESVQINTDSSKVDTLGVTTGLININSASQSDLETLPGVGPVTAGKIIDSRPFATLEELKTKKAVGNALFDKIKDKLTI